MPPQDGSRARGQARAGVLRRGPPRDAALGHTCGAEPEALPVVHQDVPCGARAVPEDVKRAAEGMVAACAAADSGEPVNAWADVHGLRGHTDATLRGQREPPGVSTTVCTKAASGGCGSSECIRSQAPSARWRAISVPEAGLGHTGVAVTSTPPTAVDGGVDRAA